MYVYLVRIFLKWNILEILKFWNEISRKDGMDKKRFDKNKFFYIIDYKGILNINKKGVIFYLI